VTATTYSVTRHPPATVVITVVITAVGFGFNVLRMRLGLDRGPLWQSMVAFLCLGALSIALSKALGRSREDLGLGSVNVPALIIGSAIATTVMVSTAFLTAPTTHIPGPGQIVGGIALFALSTGPAEELLFRGLLYGLVADARGPVTATIVSSVAFALIHVPAYGIASLPVATCAGFIFGWLRWWCRSLAGPWLVHSIADLSLLWL
jgi:membrane protease YdiL (CAAX protease family)